MANWDSILPLASIWWTRPVPDSQLQPNNNVLVLVGRHKDWDNLPLTPLMFQCGVTYSTQGKHVVYIRQSQFTAMPVEVHGMPTPQPSAMKLLKILYMTTEEELLDYLSRLHCQKVIPEAVIIENLHCYHQADQADTSIHHMAKLCSLLVDTAAFLQQQSSGTCQVVASIQLPDAAQASRPLLSVIRRFTPNTYSLTDESEDESKPAITISRMRFVNENQCNEDYIFSLTKHGHHLKCFKVSTSSGAA